MQKKLEADLMSIAHSILQMKNRDDLKALKQKAYETYEKLAVLSYIEDFVKETPQNTKTVEELVSETFTKPKTEPKEEVKEIEIPKPEVKEEVVQETEEPTKVVNVEVVEEQLEVVENDAEETKIEEEPSLDLFTKEADKKEENKNLQSSLEKEFGATVSLDIATDLFENATRVGAKKSINDVAMQQKNLQIDLNDRIALVKHLFDGSQEDYNRVVSQLNTMSEEKEALSFLKMVKKEYHWDGKEIYENRLILLIERKFN